MTTPLLFVGLIAAFLSSVLHAARFEALREVLAEREAFVISTAGENAEVMSVSARGERVLFSLPLLRRPLPGVPPYYRDLPPVTLSYDGKAILWVADAESSPKKRRYDLEKGAVEDVVTEWLPQSDNLEAANAALTPNGSATLCPCYPAFGLARTSGEPRNTQLLIAAPKKADDVATTFERFGAQPALRAMLPHVSAPIVLRELVGTRQWGAQRTLKDFTDVQYIRWSPDASVVAWVENHTTIKQEYDGPKFHPTGSQLWRFDLATKKAVSVASFTDEELARSYATHPLHLISRNTALLSLPAPRWRIPYINFFLRSDYRVVIVDMESGKKRDLMKGPARIVGIR